MSLLISFPWANLCWEEHKATDKYKMNEKFSGGFEPMHDIWLKKLSSYSPLDQKICYEQLKVKV